MSVDEKYNKPTWEYYGGVFFRKLTGLLYSYPEFMFLAKIILILVLAVLLFSLFRFKTGH